jgi:hypothetical protein
LFDERLEFLQCFPKLRKRNRSVEVFDMDSEGCDAIDEIDNVVVDFILVLQFLQSHYVGKGAWKITLRTCLINDIYCRHHSFRYRVYLSWLRKPGPPGREEKK